LVEDLSQAGRTVGAAATDPEVILHAYDVWGESCVLYLRGDFAFAIWDAPRKKLFCARDHFGIKPFFYAAREDLFLFSNTLNCLRAHPQISDELNEAGYRRFSSLRVELRRCHDNIRGHPALAARSFSDRVFD
jgi:asparagine synthase (glutamine-hydrolysing)